VTVPHEVFLAKVRACRYAFLELGVEDGVIVTRTDSLGAGLTQQIAVSHEPGDLGDQYNSFLDCEEVAPATLITATSSSIATASCCGRSASPATLSVPSRHGRGSLRARQHHLAAERRRPPLDRDRKAACGADRRHVDRIRAVIPNAKLVYNNSPSFNWTLNFRQQVYDAWKAAGKDVSAYDRRL